MKSIYLKLSIFLFVFTACGHSQIDQSNYHRLWLELDKQQCLDDIETLMAGIKLHHPQAFTFTSEEEMQAEVNRIKESLPAKVPKARFYWAVREIMALLGCGHSGVWARANNMMVPKNLQFPIMLEYFGTELYVTDPEEEKGMIAGDRILSINDREASELFDAMDKCISSDGKNSHHGRYVLNRNTSDYIPLEMGFPETYKLKVLREGKELDYTLSARTVEEDLQFYEVACKEDPCFEVSANDSTAIMTIKHFNYYRNAQDFYDFIDESFKKIEESKIKKIIIDIRGNGGGDPNCAAYLLKHFADKSFIYFNKIEGGYYDLQSEITSLRPHCLTDVSVLIDGGCGSSSGHFSSLVKYHGFATLIGEETAASYECTDNSMDFSLPESGFSVRIARNTYSTPAKGLARDRGVLPDIPLQATIEDRIQKIDVVMDYAVDRMHSKRIE